MENTKNDKYGFIYLWYDKKHKRYYIGCHWGTIDDGYICSSRWMRNTYRRRPDDFKRRIIQSNIPREELLTEEHKWLSYIKDNELKVKYYNLHKHHFGHWSNNEVSRLTAREKIKTARSEQIFTPESLKKRGDSLKAYNQTEQGKQSVLSRTSKNIGKKRSDETKLKISIAKTGKKTGPLREETKEKLRQISLENNAMHKLDIKEKHLNKVKSPEHREKMSLIMKNFHNQKKEKVGNC